MIFEKMRWCIFVMMFSAIARAEPAALDRERVGRRLQEAAERLERLERSLPYVVAGSCTRWRDDNGYYLGQVIAEVRGAREALASIAREVAGGPPESPPPPSPLLDPRAFVEWLARLRGSGLDVERWRLIEEAAREHRFTATQVARVALVFEASADRLRVVELLGPRVVDREAARALDPLFPMEADRVRARAFLNEPAR